MKRILIAIIAILITITAFADNPHHKEGESVTNNTYNTYTTIDDLSVIPMAMAQHKFNYGSYTHQKSVSASTTDSSYAISGAYAHRDCANCGLFSTSVGIADVNNEIYYGIAMGYTWGN